MNNNIYIIKLLLDYRLFEKFQTILNNLFSKQDHLEKIYLSILGYYSHTPKSIDSVENLEVIFASSYPVLRGKEQEAYQIIFSRIREANPDPALVENYLSVLRKQRLATELALKAVEVSEGSAGTESLVDLMAQFDSVESNATTVSYVTDNLEELYNKQVKDIGIRWPLECLNQALGSLRKGDFGFVFARPETGKTTLLACLAGIASKQVENPILWLNNEEQGEKVMIRCYQSILGLTTGQLFGNINKYKQEFSNLTNNRIKIYDSAIIQRREVEAMCRDLRPSLIIYDQIDKIRGFKADRRDLELGAIYQWGRELAKEYAPSIGVCQAWGAGEGIMWLTMDHVADAKTSKQAEADFIIGIGKVHDMNKANLRYLNISKNKLMGDMDSVPAMRHGQLTVLIRPEIARYEDLK